jgi:hypothetical protein
MGRSNKTFRAYRRNLVLRPDDPNESRGVWRPIATKPYYQPPVRLNRSRKWPPKLTYAA